MRYLSSVSVAAGLALCLAASPARADLAIPEANSGQGSAALLAVTSILDTASTVSGNTVLASETKSTGPTSGPATSKGIDSSNGPVSTAALATGGGSAGFFSMGVTPVFAEPSLAAPPAAVMKGIAGQPVATQTAPATDVSSMSASIGSPVLNTASLPLPNNVPTPIPGTFLLLGGGLIGIWPLRRSGRSPLAV